MITSLLAVILLLFGIGNLLSVDSGFIGWLLVGVAAVLLLTKLTVRLLVESLFKLFDGDEVTFGEVTLDVADQVSEKGYVYRAKKKKATSAKTANTKKEEVPSMTKKEVEVQVTLQVGKLEQIEKSQLLPMM